MPRREIPSGHLPVIGKVDDPEEKKINFLFFGLQIFLFACRLTARKSERNENFLRGAHSARKMIRWIIFSESGPEGPGSSSAPKIFSSATYTWVAARLPLKTCHRHVFRAFQARLRKKMKGLRPLHTSQETNEIPRFPAAARTGPPFHEGACQDRNARPRIYTRDSSVLGE